MNIIRRRIFYSVLLILVFGNPNTIIAESITIAVASNFAETAKHLIQEFEENSGHEVSLILGSSGRFFAQISNGAPFDIFLSADSEKPTTLVEAGLALPESRFTYAIGRVALWSEDENLISGDASVLSTDKFKKIAFANPRLAPYGKAAWEVLTALSLSDDLRDRLVQGENIAQTYQFVFTRNAELGFVALAQVMKNDVLTSGSAWLVPENLHLPIRQDAVLLAKSKENSAAHAFMEFLKASGGREIIRSYGYRVEDL